MNDSYFNELQEEIDGSYGDWIYEQEKSRLIEKEAELYRLRTVPHNNTQSI